MHIREAVLDDAPAITKVHIDSWRTTYSGIVPDDYLASLSYERQEQEWRDILYNLTGGQFALVVEDNAGSVIGFAAGGPVRDDVPQYKGEIYAIYLLHEHQRKGAGTRLMAAAARRLLEVGISSMLVWVLGANPSRQFYEALAGRMIRDREITIGSARLVEIAYGWSDIHQLVEDGG